MLFKGMNDDLNLKPGTKCPACGMPKPKSEGSLHLKNCPFHESYDCVACWRLEENDVKDD